MPGVSNCVKFCQDRPHEPRESEEEQSAWLPYTTASAPERHRSSSNVGGLHPVCQLDSRYLYQELPNCHVLRGRQSSAKMLSLLSWVYRLCYLTLSFIARLTGFSSLLHKLSKTADFYLATHEPVKTDGAKRFEIGVTEKLLNDAERLFRAFAYLDGVSRVLS
jgi:hypothetical protein